MLNFEAMIQKLEAHRVVMECYMEQKFLVRDYHALADAAMDLRELDAELRVLQRMQALDQDPATTPSTS